MYCQNIKYYFGDSKQCGKKRIRSGKFYKGWDKTVIVCHMCIFLITKLQKSTEEL